MANEQECVGIYIEEDMDVSQRSWLVAALEHYRGIVSAWFEHGDHHRLTIHFEHKYFSHVTLIDTIKEHGFHGKVVNI